MPAIIALIIALSTTFFAVALGFYLLLKDEDQGGLRAFGRLAGRDRKRRRRDRKRR